MSVSLRFSDVDHLGFAAQRGRLGELVGILDLSAESLGPFVEYSLLGAAHILPRPADVSWLKLDGLASLYRALQGNQRKWLCANSHCMGVFRTFDARLEETTWFGFRLAAQKAAMANGFARDTAAQLAGALGEFYSNIYEHSGAPQSGLVAFRAAPGLFEFAVADWGIGLLASLRSCSAYADLLDHGRALELALTDGVSRHGTNMDRGHGFRPLFIGLANLDGSLRFRSGDWALTIDGKNPSEMPWTLGQKIPIRGFFASIACQVA